MQRNTPLDYAEFLLTRSRTRCELHIFANGVKEKLASGYFKPFATHLREAEAQFAKGYQVIRLERPSNLLKKNKVTWFTKGTLERFVRFVSTPEVLEGVKGIEDELSQLENVRVALSKSFSQSEISYQAVDTPYSSSDVYQAKGGMSMTRQKSSKGAGNNGADTSKIELLKAMDVRLVAIKQEQSVAFARAEAAGFDSSNMADLLDFSEHFGADRLRDACVQFITLFRKRTTAQETCQDSESPLADAVSSGSDMSLESGTDFEPVVEPEQDFPSSVKEAWPKGLKSSVSNSEQQMGLDLKPALKEEKNSSTIHTSARTRSRWGPPARIQINCMEPEVCSSQGSEVLRKMGEAKHQVGSYACQDDSSRQSENEMRTFQTSEEFHSTVHLEKQFSLPKKLPLTDMAGSTSSSPIARKQQGDTQGDVFNKGGMFFTRLQKMAQQVEARRSGEDLGVRFTSVEMSDESPGSQMSVIGDSSSHFESVLKFSETIPSVMVADGVSPQPQMQESKLVQGHLTPGTSSMLQENHKVGSLHLANSSSLVTSVEEHPSIEDEVKKRADSLAKPGAIQEKISENDKIEDDQEKPVSTSARRLSVQAAISLFESKKANVGEPPTRKLGRQDSLKGAFQRQDSQKGAAQSGSSTSEKALLRRWSAIGSDSVMDTRLKAPDSAGKESEKAIEMERVSCMDENMARNSSPKIDKGPQLATDKSSTHASELLQSTFPHLIEKATYTDETMSRDSSLKTDKVRQLAIDKSSIQASRVLRNTLPHLSSAQQSAHDAPDVSSKSRSSAQQQSCVRDSANWSGDALQKQFKQELEQSLTRLAQNNVREDDSIPTNSATGSLKISDATLQKQLLESKTENKDKKRVSVSNVVQEARGLLQKEENQVCGEQNVKITSHSLVANERALRRQPSLKQGEAESSSVGILHNRHLKHETDINGENGLLFGNPVEQEKQPALVLHDTPVDLYMQALVMMIDNQHQSSLSVGDEESYKDQRGRFYEHYWRLRSARRREEPPAKRAEKEAKLKSMKETLERRRAEMEAGALRQKKKGSNLVKEQKQRVQKSGPSISQRGEEEMGEGEEVGRQDQAFYGLKPHLSKANLAKAQVPKKTAPSLQKSASARRSMTTSVPSPRTVLKKSTGTGTSANHRKSTASSYSGPIENPNHGTLPVDARRDSVRTAASVKPYEKINGGQPQFVNDAAADVIESRNAAGVVDALSSRTAEVDFTCQPSLTRKSESLDCKGETACAQALDQIVLESFKGHQDAVPETLPAFEAQKFLHRGHGMLPQPGTDILEQKAFGGKHVLQRYNEEAFSGSKSYQEATPSVSVEIGDVDFSKSLESDDLNCTNLHAVSTPSTSLDECKSNGDGSHLVNKTSSDSLDVEAASCAFEDATSDERILCFNEADQEKHGSNLSKDDQVLGKFSDGDNFLEECGTIISTEKMTEFSQSDSNSSPSVLQECTTSTYSDAVASPENSFEGHFGTVLGAHSPKPALRTGSPLGSPLSWKSFKVKHPSENDLSHSQSSPQKWVSTSQQLSKEPARGFKRLLHFGRKSRASEAVSTSGISVFTTSEGDFETEEAKEIMRLSSDELFGITKLQEKGIHKDPYLFQDQGATYSLQSSISTPSSNFKSLDEHLSGGTSSKGPRSFFSLSTFRSRGSEGKSR